MIGENSVQSSGGLSCMTDISGKDFSDIEFSDKLIEGSNLIASVFSKIVDANFLPSLTESLQKIHPLTYKVGSKDIASIESAIQSDMWKNLDFGYKEVAIKGLASAVAHYETHLDITQKALHLLSILAEKDKWDQSDDHFNDYLLNLFRDISFFYWLMKPLDSQEPLRFALENQMGPHFVGDEMYEKGLQFTENMRAEIIIFLIMLTVGGRIFLGEDHKKIIRNVFCSFIEKFVS
jgi:hypothetical protein